MALVVLLLCTLTLCVADRMSKTEYRDALRDLNAGRTVRVGVSTFWRVPNELASWLPPHRSWYLYFGGGELPESLLDSIKDDRGRRLYRAGERPVARTHPSAAREPPGQRGGWEEWMNREDQRSDLGG